MEPLVIEVGDADSYHTFTPRDLLREANEETDCSTAVKSYEELIAEFPDSPQAVRAAYNAGLCYEVDKSYTRAQAQYERALSMMSGTDELALDARLRKAYCQEKLGQFDDAARQYHVLARTRSVPESLQLGSQLREGITTLHSGRRRKGERILEQALKRVKEGISGLSDDIRASAAEAAYARAQVAAADYRALPLRMPAKVLADDLRVKTSALTVSRNEYVDAMSYRDAFWAAKAAVEVGSLYEHLHDQMAALPEPDLPDAQLEIYRQEVEHRLAPLRQHAFEAYLQVLLLAERVGFTNDATRKARERVDALEPLLSQHVMSGTVGTPVTPETPETQPTPGVDDVDDPGQDQGQERDVNGESSR